MLTAPTKMAEAEAGLKRTIKSANFNFREKCTWVLKTHFGAPTFNAVKEASKTFLASTYVMHYMEYNDSYEAKPTLETHHHLPVITGGAAMGKAFAKYYDLTDTTI